jgi:AcrR family transcriptional regulator
MRDIATAAGVAPGAAYRHFKSQEDLFIAVIAGLFADLEDRIDAAAAGSKNLRDTARNISLAYVAWGIENSGGYQLLFEVTDDEEFVKQDQRPGLHLLEKFASLIAAKSRLLPKQNEKAMLLWVAMHGLVSLRIHKTGMNWPNTIEQDVDLYLKTLLKP